MGSRSAKSFGQCFPLPSTPHPPPQPSPPLPCPKPTSPTLGKMVRNSYKKISGPYFRSELYVEKRRERTGTNEIRPERFTANRPIRVHIAPVGRTSHGTVTRALKRWADTRHNRLGLCKVGGGQTANTEIREYSPRCWRRSARRIENSCQKPGRWLFYIYIHVRAYVRKRVM